MSHNMNGIETFADPVAAKEPHEQIRVSPCHTAGAFHDDCSV